MVSFGDGRDILRVVLDDAIPRWLGHRVVGEGVVVVDEQIFNESGEAVDEPGWKTLFDRRAYIVVEPEVVLDAVVGLFPSSRHGGGGGANMENVYHDL